MTVYLDLAVLLNFLVDFLLLWGTGRLWGLPVSLKRAALAAAVGGLYAGICLLPGFRFMGAVLWRAVCLVGMCVIAFGWCKQALGQGCLFAVLSFALGGAAVKSSSFWGILLAAGVIFLLCNFSLRGRITGKTYVPVKVVLGNKEIHFTALVDTGNTLSDPISGKRVLVVSSHIAREILGLTEEALSRPLETVAKYRELGLRLIPYRAVGQPAGFLLAIRPDELIYGKEIRQELVAFAPQQIGRGEAFDALAGGVL